MGSYSPFEALVPVLVFLGICRGRLGVDLARRDLSASVKLDLDAFDIESAARRVLGLKISERALEWDRQHTFALLELGAGEGLVNCHRARRALRTWHGVLHTGL